MLDLEVAVPTLVGSYISMLAAGSVFICYLVLPPQKHFRHSLIMNLAGADFFNALNNSISGSYVVARKRIPQGHACSFNGWVGQLTVQATDFSILYIAIATVMTLRRSNSKTSIGERTKRMVFCSIWFLPLVTSSAALYLDTYRPVRSNWCAISSSKMGLRFALDHGWRLAIIITTICLYAYLFIYVHRYFSSLRSTSTPQGSRDHSRQTSEESGMSGIVILKEFEIVDEPFDTHWGPAIPHNELQYFDLAPRSPSVSPPERNVRVHQRRGSDKLLPIVLVDQLVHPALRSKGPDSSSQINLLSSNEKNPPPKTRDPLAIVWRPPPTIGATTIQVTSSKAESLWSQEKQIHKTLLLNAYPIAYVVLWIPGIANRFLELSGHHSRGLQIAQASTQFIGLANAMVYVYNERIWGLAKTWLCNKRAHNVNKQRRGETITGSSWRRAESSLTPLPPQRRLRNSSNGYALPYISEPIITQPIPKVY